jgi:CheY-like chemotaxis protein
MSETTRVLTVDDNHIQRYAMEGILRHLGFEVASAAHGEEALEKALEGSFDAVLLDINMPDINGFEVCARIRRENLDRQPAIIFHSATDASSNTIQRVNAAGGDAFLTYPIDRTHLVAVIHGAVARRNSSNN